MQKINRLIIVSLTVMFIFTACGSFTADDAEVVVPTQITSAMPFDTTSYQPSEPVLGEEPFSDEEVDAIVQTLAGECYDDKLADKRKVVEVVLNRVSDGRFGESVLEVVSAKGQFCDYWKQSRPVSESDIQIAEETLTEWYENDCEALSEYLFFCAGPNRENIFRTDY